tara:strand:- start:6485 stop:6958 length:474 start_codon:yes stop_codon:yes gene_type:complete
MCAGPGKPIADFVNRTVENVSGVTAKRQAIKQQEEANAEAGRKQAELDRLAREREAVAAQQQSQLMAYENSLKQQQAAQQAQVEELKAENAQRIGETRARGTAVVNSLRILAQDPRRAPSAQTSKKSQTKGRPRATTASLKLGTGQTGSGSGTNYSV